MTQSQGSKLLNKHDNKSTARALHVTKSVTKNSSAMYAQSPIISQFRSRITRDNFFPLHHLLSYLYRKSSRWETQQSLNKRFIHSPDLLQKVRIPKIIWWHHVLKKFKESVKNQAHKIDFQNNQPSG